MTVCIREKILILLEMGLMIHFEDNTYLLQGRKDSRDKLGRLFWPWPTSDTLMKSDPGPASHKTFCGRETHKTFQFILLGIAFQGQRICFTKVAGIIVKKKNVFCDKFLHNVNRYSWIFEQIFLPALTLIFSCRVFSKQNC